MSAAGIRARTPEVTEQHEWPQSADIAVRKYGFPQLLLFL